MKRKAPPRWNGPKIETFQNENGAVKVSRGQIQIIGTMESAAKALAEAILKADFRPTYGLEYEWKCFDTLVAYQVSIEGKKVYTLSLLAPQAIDTETWTILKNYVEKMCNNLTAYL